MTDPFLFECIAIRGRCRVLGFRGTEELGRCFQYDVFFTVSTDDSLALEPGSVLGQEATLTLGEHAIRGRAGELELLAEAPFPVFRMRLVPALWFLGLSAHSRVFVSESIPDLIRRIFAQADIDSRTFEFRLAKQYDKRAHVCQYRESDLDFIQRWMEREGLYYFFDHGEGASKLIICDAVELHGSLRSRAVPYHPADADESAGEHFRVFQASLAALPMQVVEGDYNHLTPDLPIVASAAVAPGLRAYIRRWGENESDQAGARRVAQLDAERELCRRTRSFANGRALGVHAGFNFTVDRHPVTELNREYLAVRVVLLGQAHERQELVEGFFNPEEVAKLGRDVLQIEVEGIASHVQFRSERHTRWPRVAGLELGIVDGAADNDYAQLDEHGRYLVELMREENNTAAGRASTQIRMIQPHAGAPEGWHLPLRKGTEVVIAFIGGDPDQPVIAGAVPNAHAPSPVTRANHTQNVLLTGGLSRVEMEDNSDRQYIDVSTPPQETYLHLGAHAGLGDHNIAFSTSGDGLLHTGGNRDITIGGEQNEDVQGKLTETYRANQTTHVAAAFEEVVHSGAEQIIHAGSIQTISGGSTQTIHGGEARSVSGGATETITASRTQTIDGTSTESVTSTQNQTIGGTAAVATGSTYKVTAGGGVTLQTPARMNMMSSSWLMNAAGGQMNLDNCWISLASENCKTYSVQFQPNYVAVNVAALTVGVIGQRSDTFHAKAEASVATLQNAGMKQESGAFKKVVDGTTIAMGFLMFV